LHSAVHLGPSSAISTWSRGATSSGVVGDDGCYGGLRTSSYSAVHFGPSNAISTWSRGATSL